MRPEEAQIGRRVRVRDDYRKTSFRGWEGTIAKRWGDPGYPALDVLLDEGDWQLFWFHELEEVDEDAGHDEIVDAGSVDARSVPIEMPSEKELRKGRAKPLGHR